MTTVRDQIHALRWRAAADALDIDPSADPNIAGLAELREAKTARQRLADECHRVADSATQTAAELAEIQDLLSERMALLDAERPGATIIDLLKGMLEATAQLPAAAGRLDMEALLAHFPGATNIVIIDNHKMVPGGHYPQVTRVRSTRGEAGRYSIHGNIEQGAAVLLEALTDGSVEVHKNRHGATGRILSPLAQMRERFEAEVKHSAFLKNQLVAAEKEVVDIKRELADLQRSLAAAQGAARVAETPEDLLVLGPRLRAMGPALRRLRLEHGLQISDLARATDANVPMLAAIELGLEPLWDRMLDSKEAARLLGRVPAGSDLEAAARNTLLREEVGDLKREIESIRARSNSRADALRILGWDGTGCPEAWAENCKRVYGGIKPAAEPEPALGAAGAVVSARDALRRGDKSSAQSILERAAKTSSATATDAEQTIAAHRWQAVDLQALLGHERHMRREADKDLHELTRPLWPWLTLRDIAPRGIVRQLVEVLQNQHKSLTHNGSIPEFDGPDE